ncbi:MAG: plastocyanin/azurin family copper-binding protein [Candidatus Binatia bacterium]
MKSLMFWLLVGVLIGLPSAVRAADASGFGIVKGTITVGGKPAPDAVVSIEGLSPDQIKTQMAHTKPQKKVIDQRNLKFIPTVVAIMAGETVDFPNNDKTWHNVYSKGGANDFDLGLYASGKTRSKKFDKPGVSRILCNAHPNMEAFVVVKDHPFFSTTDSLGNYEIKNVPLGKVRVEIWYPNLEVRSDNIEIVRDGQVFALSVDLKKR